MVSNCHQFLGQRSDLEGEQRVEFMSGKIVYFFYVDILWGML